MQYLETTSTLLLTSQGTIFCNYVIQVQTGIVIPSVTYFLKFGNLRDFFKWWQ